MNLILADSFENNKKEVFFDLPQKLDNKEYIAPKATLNEKRCTFQRTMKLTLLIGQCFGLNPVLGVCETDVSKLRFCAYSYKNIYSYISILGQLGLFVLCVVNMTQQEDKSFWGNTSLVFYGTNCMTSIVFVRIASKWPKLCQLIAKTEGTDPTVSTTLVRKCNIACVVILLLALAEHLLADLSGLAISMDCQLDRNWYDAYMLQCFPWVWACIPYSRFKGALVMGLNFQCTFNWNFADVFVICVSYYLTARLEQINDRMEAMRGKIVPNFFWRTMREDYSRTTNLIKRVDNVVNGIIFISFANNLFYICLQLLHVLEDGVKTHPACDKPLEERPLKGYEHSVYFIYSFGFLLARSLAVSIVAAQVHTASRGPARALYDVPSPSYCIEVQRFLDQVHGDTVALSGLQFFNVKRGLVLTVAGTIVTYELVLMQFTGINPTILPPAVPIDIDSSSSTVTPT